MRASARKGLSGREDGVRFLINGVLLLTNGVRFLIKGLLFLIYCS